jgi:Tol biopolymer transport system component
MSSEADARMFYVPCFIVLMLHIGGCGNNPLPPPSPVAPHGLLVMTDANRTIYTVRDDGSDKKLLTTSGDSPSWTPDGKIIFVSNRSGSRQIWLMDEDGGNPQQIGQMTSNPVMPQEARNGLIAFMGGDQGDSILTMKKDGSGLQELVTHGMQPSLAISGTWLAYTVQTENPYHREIWRINVDGTGLQQLTFLGDTDYPDANAPSISPDETVIAFFSGKAATQRSAGPTQSIFTFGHRDIAIIPAGGGVRNTLTGCKPVTTQAELIALGPFDCIVADNPAWTPDGKRIIFDQVMKKPNVAGIIKAFTGIIDINGQNRQVFYPTPHGVVPVPMKYVK